MEFTADELIRFVQVLKECNCSHFKNGNIELSFGDKPKTVSVPVLQTKDLVPTSLEKPPEIKDDEQAPHIIQDVKRILSLSDEDLLDKIMPLPSPEEMP